MTFSFTKRMRSCMLSANVFVFFCIALWFWLPNILDTVRYHVDLSYTIEWGPTYWVENWMRDLGEPGIKLLCNTRADAPRHAVSGAVKELWYVRDPVYFDLFATAYSNPSSPIRGSLLNAICCMYGKAQSASTSDDNVKKISTFLEQVFNSNSTSVDKRQMAMAALWAGNVKQLLVLTEDKNPAIAGRAVFLLAEAQPVSHLATFGAFLGDITKPDELREAFAAEWRQTHYRTQRRPSDTPLKLQELFGAALTACRSDGTPHNPVRVSIWKGLYWQTGKGVPITLSNSQQTLDWLDTMSDTVRSYWDFKYSGKGIPPPSESDAIETVRKCVTVPETDEDGDNRLVRRAMEFLDRKEIPQRPHENLTVQRAMRDLGLTDMTVAEILSSDRVEDIRKIIPYLVQSKYFGPPTGRQQWPNRLRGIKAVRNLVKLGPEAFPVLLQCYQANAFDQMVLLNAMEVCDRLKERLENVLYFIPKPNDNRTSEVERDRLLADYRNWLFAESKPDGMLHRVCWIRPILLNKDGPLFVPYRDLCFTRKMSNYESDSGGGLPYWLPMIPDRKHQFVSLTAKYREKSQDTWQVFSAPVCTNLSPGIRVLELRADESK